MRKPAYNSRHARLLVSVRCTSFFHRLHKYIIANSRVKVYFAHPYSPWERPTNENTNGLIRNYFPKGTDFNLLSKKNIFEVQNQINERPRKTLEYESPLNTVSRLYMNQNFI
nr:IS30 family transposase [Flavobacterium sp.]